ncbi:MAG: hypothetical protein ABSA68_04905 [Xanthobacteraceae bacterium]|jgi:hypothetical protein
MKSKVDEINVLISEIDKAKVAAAKLGLATTACLLRMVTLDLLANIYDVYDTAQNARQRTHP